MQQRNGKVAVCKDVQSVLLIQSRSRMHHKIKLLQIAPLSQSLYTIVAGRFNQFATLPMTYFIL
uniref:Uncharacterized protein n=1 Tax=Ciona savignyi TaxID=51511 RepID=H2YWA2_CIOSA